MPLVLGLVYSVERSAIVIDDRGKCQMEETRKQ